MSYKYEKISHKYEKMSYDYKKSEKILRYKKSLNP